MASLLTVIVACVLVAAQASAHSSSLALPLLDQFQEAVWPRIHVSKDTPYLSQQGYTISNFRHENCGGANDAIKINHLSITSNLLITASVTLRADIVAPVQVKLDLAKKVLFFITVPCTNNIGSCTYPDVCARLEEGTCHPQAEALGLCKCPFSAATHEVQDLDLLVSFLEGAEIPPTLEALLPGDWRAKATVTNNGNALGCIQLFFTLSKA